MMNFAQYLMTMYHMTIREFNKCSQEFKTYLETEYAMEYGG